MHGKENNESTCAIDCTISPYICSDHIKRKYSQII